MTENTIEFAWAIPVKVEVLGAHLEAYDNLQPLINTLRLCNRFGRGEDAFITKLPVELIQQVEDYLMVKERAKLRVKWAKNLRCWEDRCRPIDHLGTDDILELFNSWSVDMEWVNVCSECRVHHGDPATEVNWWVKQCVAELLEDFVDDGDTEDWEDGHILRIQAWFQYVGEPTEKTRGKLGQLSSIMSKHFGVDLWISHVQEEREAKLWIGNKSHSTKAYLRLAEKSTMRHDVSPSYHDYEVEPMRIKTEAGYARGLVLPNQPTDKSLTRFSRAVKILNLDYSKSKSSTPPVAITPTAATEDAITTVESMSEEQSSTNTTHVQPQLTMFIRSNDGS